MKVHSTGTQDGIDRVSLCSLEAIAVKTVLGFEMTDAGLYGRSPFHPFPESAWCASSPFLIHVDRSVFFFGSMASVALIDAEVIGFALTETLDLLQALVQGVAIIRIAGKGQCSEVPAAFARRCAPGYVCDV